MTMHRWLSLVFLLLAAPASAATYYVDCNAADDTKDGLSPANAWKTVAKVNSSSFSAGESVLLKKGCTWRETLTVPSSGSAGSPITFGAYGTGAAPILTGADLIAPGTSWAADVASATASWTGLAQTGAAWGNDSSNTYNYRTIVLGSISSTSGTEVRVGFRGSDGHTQTVQAVSIGLRSGVDDFYGTPTAMKLGGSVISSANPLTVAAGLTTITYTDWLPFTFDETLDYLVHFWCEGTMAYNSISSPASGTNSYASSTSTDMSLTQNVTMTGQRHIMLFDSVDVRSAKPNVWTATVTTEPKVVLFDGVLGTKVASAAACVAARNWYWESNVLYVYSTSDPDTAYTGPGIEAANRDNTIVVNAKDYITVDGLTVQMSSAGVGVAVQGSADHITIQNSTVRWNGTDGINFYSTQVGGGNLVSGNTVEYNNAAGINFSNHTGSGAGTESIVRGNTSRYNGTDGIVVRGNYCIVENNTVTGNGTKSEYASGIHVYSGGVGEGTGDNNIVRRNIVTGTQGSSVDGDGIAIDRWCDSNQVYYNVVYGNNGACGYLYDSAGSSVYNNVCYGNMLNSARTVKGEWELYSSASDLTSGALVKNNIFRATQANVYAITVDARTYDNAGLDITNNIHYAAASDWYYWNATGGNVLATWNAFTGVGTDLNSDPLFVSATDFHLRPGSPAINAGVDMGLTTDFSGRPVGGLPDIGAYEFYPPMAPPAFPGASAGPASTFPPS